MRKILYPLILTFFLCATAFGQTGEVRQEFLNSNDSRNTIEFYSEFYEASNALTHQLATDYYLRKFIDKSTKDNVSTQLSANNRFGVGFRGNLNYIYQPEKINTRFIFTVQHHLFNECQFNKDIFELYFRGNKSFAGKTANLDHSAFNSILYYQLGFGIGQGTLNDKTNWFVIASLCIGNEFMDIESKKGSMFTAADGTYLDADLGINMHKSDSTHAGLFHPTGKGIAITAGISTLLGENSRLHFDIRNIGFIRFNNQSAHAGIDSTLRFEGINVNSIFSLTDSFTVVRNDSNYVESFINHRRKESYNRALPGLADLWIEKWLPGNMWNVAIGLRIPVLNLALPLGWMDISKRVKGSSTLRFHTQYGGYAGWNAGLGYQYEKKSWKACISSDFLSSWLNLRKGTSMGAFISLSKSF